MKHISCYSYFSISLVSPPWSELTYCNLYRLKKWAKYLVAYKLINLMLPWRKILVSSTKCLSLDAIACLGVWGTSWLVHYLCVYNSLMCGVKQKLRCFFIYLCFRFQSLNIIIVLVLKFYLLVATSSHFYEIHLKYELLKVLNVISINTTLVIWSNMVTFVYVWSNRLYIITFCFKY